MPDFDQRWVCSRREAISACGCAVILAACAKPIGAADTGSREGAPAAVRRSFGLDLYRCEGCEGAFERDAKTLDWRARIGSEREPGEPLTVSGTVYRVDGSTPAEHVVVYAYHTNAAGLYAGGSNETEWSRRHGRLRGWARTKSDGRYEFKTIKPGPYPSHDMPAHIHLSVVEPGKPPYWIDDIVFSGEFGVTADYTSKREDRGGTGIIRLGRAPKGELLAVRDIILEQHPTGSR